MAVNFKEKNLGQDFCKDYIKKVGGLIRASTSFTVVGMPGMGISIFLRYLATTNLAYFVHVDINELPSLTKNELFKLLFKELGGQTFGILDDQYLELCKKQIEQIITGQQKLVVIFNRFDKLKSQFDPSFFDNLRALRDIDKEKIVMIFSANRPLVEQYPQMFTGGNLNMFSQSYYLKPFSKEDLKKLIDLNSPFAKSDPQKLETAIKLCGGHYQLLQLLLKSDYLESDPLLDPVIKLQLKELSEYLKFEERKSLQKFSVGKRVGINNQFLLDLGFINGTQFFSPLLLRYLKSTLNLKLPPRETKLFKLLKSRLGKTITKDEIFNVVWKDDEDKATDWALDALIYRLRRNLKTGYVIENQKKVGYYLVKT